jgi:hypothetical protein
MDFTKYFVSVDDLKKFIQTQNEFINVDGLNDKIIDVYKQMAKSDLKIKSSILFDVCQKFLSFKHRSAFKIDFWIERGFGMEEYNKWISVRRAVKIALPLSDDSINKFSYGKFSFNFTGEPKCNICNSNLTYNLITNTYNIVCCNNKLCASSENKDISTIRQFAFLPLSLFKKNNKKTNINSKLSKEYWLLKGFSYNDSLEKIAEIRNALSNISQNTLEYNKIITDKSEEEIKKENRSNSNRTNEFWIKKGMTEDEAILKVSDLQKNSADAFANKIKTTTQYSAISDTQIFYWINKGFDYKTASKKVSERQTTFSKEKCILKHGEEEGLKVFLNRQFKWQESLVAGGKLKNGYSQVSQELFYNLLELYEISERDDVYFATKNHEYVLNNKEGNIWLCDFVDLKNKKIIEYNGDKFHANPNKYLPEDCPHPFKKDLTAKDIWESEKLKIDFANKKGFEVLVIWDSEYKNKKTKQIIIDKCINFLNKKDNETNEK